MQMFKGQVDGIVVAEYKKPGSNFKITCKISNGFYCITFYNGRQTSATRYTKDKNEANQYIKQHILAEGWKRAK